MLPKASHGPTCALIAVLLVTLLGMHSTASSEVAATKQKKYPDPHQLHLEARSEGSADFLVDEIGDWPGFIRTLQGRSQVLQLGPEAKMIIGTLRPEGIGDDEKIIVITIFNKLLLEKNLAARTKSIGQSGSETLKMQQAFKQNKGVAELKWLNRSILCDSFPQITRKQRIAELIKISCATCHEAWGLKAWGQLNNVGLKDPVKEAVSESSLSDCISKAIAGKKTVEECAEMVKAIRKSRIEPYGPLKNFIQRTGENEIPLLAAVHSEDPYTFKPLLKRLVCLECHSRGRKVDRVMGSDGKVKTIKIFYGAGVEVKP